MGGWVLISVFVLAMGLSSGPADAVDCNSGGRYEDNGEGTVTDCRTGMVWLKDAACTSTSGGVSNPNGYISWYSAMKWAAGLGDGLCGLSDGSGAGDWRLPTKTEWMAMVAYAKSRFSNPALTNGAGSDHWTSGDSFSNVQSNLYWSSTTLQENGNYAWVISMSDGVIYNANKPNTIYVWPVRSGQSASFGQLFLE
jgi:hypothetical protein